MTEPDLLTLLLQDAPEGDRVELGFQSDPVPQHVDHAGVDEETRQQRPGRDRDDLR